MLWENLNGLSGSSDYSNCLNKAWYASETSGSLCDWNIKYKYRNQFSHLFPGQNVAEGFKSIQATQSQHIFSLHVSGLQIVPFEDLY